MSNPTEVNPVVNEQDAIIGYKKRIDIMPSDIYRVASLWVTNSRGDILLAQRGLHKKHHPGKWGPAVAGTVEQGESYRDNIIKEAAEEIGQKDIEPIEGPKLRFRGEHDHFTQFFLYTTDQSADQFALEDDVAQVRWFGREELLDALATHPDDFLAGIGIMLKHT